MVSFLFLQNTKKSHKKKDCYLALGLKVVSDTAVKSGIWNLVQRNIYVSMNYT
jgi:hypothetical protein